METECVCVCCYPYVNQFTVACWCLNATARLSFTNVDWVGCGTALPIWDKKKKKSLKTIIKNICFNFYPLNQFGYFYPT